MELDENSLFSSNWRMFYCLRPFLFDPLGEKYGLEIEKEARQAGFRISHETALFYLNHYCRTGILKKNRKGRQVFFSLMAHNALPIMSLLEQDRTNLFMRESGIAMQVSEISGLLEGSYFALLFGSAARQHQRQSSDIDILLVGGKYGSEEISRKEAAYGTKISIHPVSKKELEERWHSEPIYKGIWKDRIVLKNFHNFWEFALKGGKP